MKPSEKSGPLERIIDLSVLSQAGLEIAIAPGSEDLACLAKWVGVDAVERFEATVKLKKLSQTRFAYSAHFKADVVQACVATLEPVASHIEQQFARELHLTAGKAARLDTALDFDGALLLSTDETLEEIPSPRYDVAAPVLEAFVLAIDLYPRREGAEFSGLENLAEKPEILL